MSDGDAFMHETGEVAPTVSGVAAQLSKQNLGRRLSESTQAVIDKVCRKDQQNHERVAKHFIDQAKLARAGKLGRGKLQDGKDAAGAPAKNPEGGLAETDPASAIAVIVRTGTEASSKPGAEDVGEHVGEPTGKGQRKRGKRKRGRGGQGAEPGPDRQQAVPVVNTHRPGGLEQGDQNRRLPNPDTRPNLSLPREQRQAEVGRRLAGHYQPRPTRWDSLPEPSPRRSPPRRNDRRSPPRPALDDRRRQRTPSPVDRRPVPDDSKLLGFVAGALELIKERVLWV